MGMPGGEIIGAGMEALGGAAGGAGALAEGLGGTAAAVPEFGADVATGIGEAGADVAVGDGLAPEAPIEVDDFDGPDKRGDAGADETGDGMVDTIPPEDLEETTFNPFAPEPDALPPAAEAAEAEAAVAEADAADTETADAEATETTETAQDVTEPETAVTEPEVPEADSELAEPEVAETEPEVAEPVVDEGLVDLKDNGVEDTEDPETAAETDDIVNDSLPADNEVPEADEDSGATDATDDVIEGKIVTAEYVEEHTGHPAPPDVGHGEIDRDGLLPGGVLHGGDAPAATHADGAGDTFAVNGDEGLDLDAEPEVNGDGSHSHDAVEPLVDDSSDLAEEAPEEHLTDLPDDAEPGAVDSQLDEPQADQEQDAVDTLDPQQAEDLQTEPPIEELVDPEADSEENLVDEAGTDGAVDDAEADAEVTDDATDQTADDQEVKNETEDEPEPDNATDNRLPTRLAGHYAAMQADLDAMTAKLQNILDQHEAAERAAAAAAEGTSDVATDVATGQETGDATTETGATDLESDALHVKTADVDAAAELNELGVPTRNADVKELTDDTPDGKALQTVWDQLKARADQAGHRLVTKIENGTVERLKIFGDEQIQVELVRVFTDQMARERLFLRTGLTEDKIPKEWRNQPIGHAAHAGLIQSRAGGRQAHRQALQEQIGAVGFTAFRQHLTAALKERNLGKAIVEGELARRTEETIAKMQARRDTLIKNGVLKPGDLEGTKPVSSRLGPGNARNYHSKQAIKNMRRMGESPKQHAKRVARNTGNRPSSQPNEGRRAPRNPGKVRRAAHGVREFHNNNVKHNKAHAQVRQLEEKLHHLRTAKKVQNRGQQIRAVKAQLKVAKQERFTHSFTGRLLNHTLDAIGV